MEIKRIGTKADIDINVNLSALHDKKFRLCEITEDSEGHICKREILISIDAIHSVILIFTQFKDFPDIIRLNEYENLKEIMRDMEYTDIERINNIKVDSISYY